MSAVFEENFDTTGGSVDRLLEGIWSAVGFSSIGTAELEIPSFETQGRYWLKVNGRADGMRAALGGSFSSIGAFCIFRMQELPEDDNAALPLVFRDGSNSNTFRLAVRPTGQILVYNTVGALVASSTTFPIRAGTTHKMQVQAVFDGSAGSIEVRVDGTTVILAASLALAGTADQVGHFQDDSSFKTYTPFWVKCVAVYSLTGTYNDDWPAIDDVITLYPDADTVDAGWTPRPRQKIEEGVMQAGTAGALDLGTGSAFDLGSDDFTLESFVRFRELPTGSNRAQIFGKYDSSADGRGYMLSKYGPAVNSGKLQFEISTDGAVTGQVTVFSADWEPQIGRWYHVAVCRASAVTRVFIDGVQLGVNVSDANTYAASAAKLAVGAAIDNAGEAVEAGSAFDGFFDETRITVGTARYTTNFTPTTVPFPRNLAGDPAFADVVFLAGYDVALVDESSYANTVSARGTAARIEPDDGAFAYETINAVSPLDDRLLEAALVQASGILTLTANAAPAETVTLGATTYTFVSALTGANDVLIGADLNASLNNLAAAVNGGAGAGTVYGTGTSANLSATAAVSPTPSQLTATAITGGAAGNSIVSTETLASGSWTAATLAGGQDIPGPSRFGLDTLSPFVTGVRWIGVRSRAWVEDGTGELTVSLDVSGAQDAATGVSLSSAPTYYVARFEEDPNTTSALTPTSIENGSIELDRTA